VFRWKAVTQLKIFHPEKTTILHVIAGGLKLNGRWFIMGGWHHTGVIFRAPCIQRPNTHRTRKCIKIGVLPGQVKKFIPLGPIEKHAQIKIPERRIETQRVYKVGMRVSDHRTVKTIDNTIGYIVGSGNVLVFESTHPGTVIRSTAFDVRFTLIDAQYLIAVEGPQRGTSSHDRSSHSPQGQVRLFGYGRSQTDQRVFVTGNRRSYIKCERISTG